MPWPPKKGQAFSFEVPPVRDATGDIVTSGTLSARISLDGANDVATSNPPTFVAPTNKMITLSLTDSEMDVNRVTGVVSSNLVGSKDAWFEIFPEINSLGDFSQIIECVVDVGASTTSIPTSSQSPAAAVTDQWKGRIVIFRRDTTTAALRGAATDITGHSAGGTLTVTALTTTPVSGDTFIIV